LVTPRKRKLDLSQFEKTGNKCCQCTWIHAIRPFIKGKRLVYTLEAQKSQCYRVFWWHVSVDTDNPWLRWHLLGQGNCCNREQQQTCRLPPHCQLFRTNSHKGTQVQWEMESTTFIYFYGYYLKNSSFSYEL